jgi:hypothetical protein
MKKIAALLYLLAILPLASAAQTAASAPPAEMKKLDFIVGQWKGEGWIEMRPGQRETFTINESAQRKVEGAVLLLEGLGTRQTTDKTEGAPVHKAFAVIDYDVQAKAFRMRSYRVGTGAIDALPQVGDNMLVWGFHDARGGEVRFTIKLDEKGQWFEIGEYSGDGKTWRKFMEMTLSRVA